MCSTTFSACDMLIWLVPILSTCSREENRHFLWGGLRPISRPPKPGFLPDDLVWTHPTRHNMFHHLLAWALTNPGMHIELQCQTYKAASRRRPRTYSDSPFVHLVSCKYSATSGLAPSPVTPPRLTLLAGNSWAKQILWISQAIGGSWDTSQGSQVHC